MGRASARLEFFPLLRGEGGRRRRSGEGSFAGVIRNPSQRGSTDLMCKVRGFSAGCTRTNRRPSNLEKVGATLLACTAHAARRNFPQWGQVASVAFAGMPQLGQTSVAARGFCATRSGKGSTAGGIAWTSAGA